MKVFLFIIILKVREEVVSSFYFDSIFIFSIPILVSLIINILFSKSFEVYFNHLSLFIYAVHVSDNIYIEVDANRLVKYIVVEIVTVSEWLCSTD